MITGASRGIGVQTAIQFAKEGANIIIDYFVSDYEPDAKENAEHVKQEVEKLGSKAITVSSDSSYITGQVIIIDGGTSI